MFSIFRESSGLTYKFINATKQYLKSWVSISLFNALFKSRDVPMIHSELFYPVNLVHIFPTPFFRQRLYKLDSRGLTVRPRIILTGQGSSLFSQPPSV